MDPAVWLVASNRRFDVPSIEFPEWRRRRVWRNGRKAIQKHASGFIANPCEFVDVSVGHAVVLKASGRRRFSFPTILATSC